MKAEQLLTLAINTLHRWQDEVVERGEEDLMIAPSIIILNYALANLDNRTSAPVRHGIALAYAVLGTEDV